MAIDVVCVLVFVAIGRSVHDHGIDAAGLVSTAWPFLVGLSVGWLVVVLIGLDGTGLVDGGVVTVLTVTIGMVLRSVADQGVDVAFVLVALGFLGAFLLTWRVVREALRSVHRRAL